MLARLSAALLCLLTVACASNKATVQEGVDPSQWTSAYVVRHDKDSHNIDRAFVDALHSHGLDAVSGPQRDSTDAVDIQLEYVDRWNWDMTMYLRSLRVEVRDPANQRLLASAEAMRDSLTRENPADTARKLMDEIFGVSTEPAKEPESERYEDDW